MQELEKILEEIRKAFEENTEYIADEDGCHHFVIDGCTATYLVNQIILKHMNDGWISVDGRLPEVGEYVLGTTKSGEVLIFRYGWNSPHTRKMFFHLCGAAATIIAWRPLPEPYRPKKESEGSRRLREREEFFKG